MTSSSAQQPASTYPLTQWIARWRNIPRPLQFFLAVAVTLLTAASALLVR